MSHEPEKVRACARVLRELADKIEGGAEIEHFEVEHGVENEDLLEPPYPIKFPSGRITVIATIFSKADADRHRDEAYRRN